MLKRYSKYKSSGVEWIGEIPTEWSCVPIKFIATVQNGATPSSSEDSYWDGDINWVTTDDLGKLTTKTITNSRRKITKAGYESCGTQMAKKGSVVLSTRAPIGHLGILDIDACTNQGCKTIVPTKINSEFCYYCLKVARPFLESLGEGSTFKELPTYKLKSFLLPVPPIEIQNQITHYLTVKIDLIDKLIADKKKLIEILNEERIAIINQAVTKGIEPYVPVRNSGIEWLGQIPNHWKLSKLKYPCIFIKDGTHGSFSRVEDGFRLLSVRNIINNKFVFREDDSRVSENDFNLISSPFLIGKDDIQLAIVGATLGKVALVEDVTEKFVTQRSLATIRTDTKMLRPKFLYYFLMSEAYQSFLWLNVGFSAQPGIYLGTLQNSHICYPSLDEQEEIISSIEKEIDKIKKVLEKIAQEIGLLVEYKTVLISEVVTGKVDVRDEVESVSLATA